MNKTYSRQMRRPMAYVSSYIVNHIYQRNPWVTVWWSAAFPGCGHLMICKYFTGIMLIAWEFFINIQAHVNEAIYYSMIGKFDVAKQVLDTRWFLLYIAVYIFAMWDCYSLTTDLNKFALLADREDSSILPFNIGALEVNYLDNRNSWLGVAWAYFNPGLGSLYIGRLPTGFYAMIWFVVTVYYAHLLPAIQSTFIGQFQSAKDVLDPEWLLFLPSIVGFASHDTYIQSKALNQLFKVEQSRFLAGKYQTPTFKILGEKRMMLIIATFKHSAYLELALKLLEQKGISASDLLVTPLEKVPRDELSELNVTHKDGKSPVDLAFIFSMIFMLLGAIYGFVLAWGPIIWSLIGMVIGALVGLLLDFLLGKKPFSQHKNTEGEVVLVVSCNSDQTDTVQNILWKHRALGVSKIAPGNEG